MTMASLFCVIYFVCCIVFSIATGSPGDTDAHSTTTCCIRESKIIIAGFDLRRRPIILDIGQCKKGCKDGSTDAQADHTPCPHRGTCRPNRTRIEQVRLYGPEKEFEVVEECACLARRTGCGRQTLTQVLFPDSPYEVEVDVGACQGHCHQGHGSCSPLRNRTIQVPGPNGAECVSVIEECQCASPCYRVQHFQSFYDTKIDDKTFEIKKIERRLDVGKCVGSCGENSNTFRCVMRSPDNVKECLMSLQHRDKSCTASSYSQHTYTASDLRQRTLFSIKDCACQ
ncbi:uncharacterized protein LOC106160997 [Lingula anatina]|uniref:Uncharacterized protein LOC106160997 n=1 Tax=Lingula anatina TaxID=7574 RepID=A0A1S3I604_LINAN|nr:uncharacterized protein LOC106160997 [Lingula anatina]|eukprot:XP_013393276.1 uncharacterized protein LOC106160997 [Lingula anatina]